MRIDCPTGAQIPALQALWQAAFGDSEDIIRDFFATAYAPHRCRCVTENGELTAALYILDTFCRGDKFAYLYAVATDPAYRNRGYFRALMADTHRYLRGNGYAGVLLYPADDTLRQTYARMGYRNAAKVRTIACDAAMESAGLREISAAEYGDLRKAYLSDADVQHAEENLRFLASFARFYAGDGFVTAAETRNNSVIGYELLGDPSKAPAIVKALGTERGCFTTKGTEEPYAMFLPLQEGTTAPDYFGLNLQ